MTPASTASKPTLVSLDDFRAAASALRGVAVRTPLIVSDALEARFGVRVYLKPEMLQRGGAFKFRGAYWFVSQLAQERRAKGLVAPSSGNHGQAVALAARLFGVPATVVMPTTATRAKREGAERLGARVILEGTTTADRMAKAQEICARDGATLVPPFDDATIIAGQGTIGLEIVEDMPDVELVLVAVGGGGLSAGIAAAVKQAAPAARVIGVEPAGSPKLTRAREAGGPVTIPANPGGIADGLLAVRIGTLNYAHHEAFLDGVVTVGDAALPGAMRFLLERHKLVAEPSGAITVAALLEGAVKPGPRTVCVLSGGNIEWDGLLANLGTTA
ncbi:MAG TPA: threonine/serine dehydratase [Gemmatimonadaceae bacterium]|nr:threonine/serine dehydratase [Gemmatimonadaceae bacterium]